MTAELTIGQIIALSRRLGEKNLEMHKGTWNKVINYTHIIFRNTKKLDHQSAKGCYEIRGKTLGIVGYGHIGSQVSNTILVWIFMCHIKCAVVWYDFKRRNGQNVSSGTNQSRNNSHQYLYYVQLLCDDCTRFQEANLRHPQLSVLAESMGMNVIYYDINPVMPLGNSTAMSHLDDLLKKVRRDELENCLVDTVFPLGRFCDAARARDTTDQEYDHKAAIEIDAQGLVPLERVTRDRR